MDFEELFNKAIDALISINGGSLESALDDMRVGDKKEREQIAKYLNWYDEEEDEED